MEGERETHQDDREKTGQGARGERRQTHAADVMDLVSHSSLGTYNIQTLLVQLK